jgi:Vanillate O-demethylase oxygenase C-terminal domain
VRIPGNAIIRAIFVPAGTGGDETKLDERAFVMDSYNFITPIDEQHARYFWFQLRNFAANDALVSEAMTVAVRAAFEEDRVILNAVQAGFASSQSPHIHLPTDNAPLRFRRKIKERIGLELAEQRDEQQGPSVTEG